ncbi:FAD-dependent monooxygenase, partial [Mycobacterium riyadhense]
MVSAGQCVDVDVLVVGAGPVGLTLANILGLHDVRTLVVGERGPRVGKPRGGWVGAAGVGPV